MKPVSPSDAGMPLSWQGRARTACRAAGAALWVAVAGASIVASGVAQGGATDSAVVPPSFQSMGQAVQSNDYTIVQLRRFRDAQANVVSVRECLQVDANGSNSPIYALTFVGVEGELPGSPAFLTWQQVYSRFSSLFFEHGTFRVRNLQKAQANYTVHDFGTATRANRMVSRIVVFPQSLDKAIWLIDVDVQTQVPLYTAEFDSQLRLLSEVEAVSFMASVSMPPPAASAVNSILHPDYPSADSSLGHPQGLIEPQVSFASDYSVERIAVRVDPINNLQKLVISYTDGVDQFMIAQAPGIDDVFADLAKATASTGPNHTIARYRDPAMTVLLFWEGGVAFQVAGRGALHRLDEVARRLYLQALSSN
ncbi:MAG TPA: hypothetical protein VF384_11535 [Planctomycetota bacterium]